jgi:hypothetical protein
MSGMKERGEQAQREPRGERSAERKRSGAIDTREAFAEAFIDALRDILQDERPHAA